MFVSNYCHQRRRNRGGNNGYVDILNYFNPRFEMIQDCFLGIMRGDAVAVYSNPCSSKARNPHGMPIFLGNPILRQSHALQASSYLQKFNPSRWANFRSFNSSNGCSACGGQMPGAYYSEDVGRPTLSLFPPDP